MRKYRKIWEKLAESVLFSSSTVTSLTVILIIVFLWREGVGLFNSKPVDKGYVFALNQANPVNTLSAKQLKDIFNQDITNWKEVGGANDTIILLTINEIPNYFTEEEMGTDLENLPVLIDRLILENSGAIVFISENYMPQDFHGRILDVEKISLKEFTFGTEWYPTAEPVPLFGVWPLILGTLLVTLGAIVFALPLGLATAIYLAEVSSFRMRNIIKPLVELLAGIPSVVFGFFGLVVLVPLIQQVFSLDVGETALAGSIILGIMALPTIITISEDALRTTPKSLKEASLALGATRWQTMVRVTIPYARSGITTAIILGIGRAIGETMAVLMVTGNAAMIPTSFLMPVRTIPATIAAELGESPYGGLHFQALFALGIILFLFTLIINFFIELVKGRKHIKTL
ncbi:MAG TPA: phosphate ABC transporter permease subunit PstC [Bacteroidales bacterium]|nr:phosphate ABC transporter permease subunit PstC [Bacteroidales bacterium]HNQ82551.1 phosphate ABC transporter permease subunit PstC [Bacteroidales bacterium]HOX77603.1 phosphate ABC transporter permease subunit PstC [Bacteroidales bacterium]HPI86080.1 phosphate ABC transporter permease subunit PstC [Bacteroidales bacterium]HPM91199.1 phosphate ABC transporter permease subunit PstC [Bacteroidales bacterium]